MTLDERKRLARRRLTVGVIGFWMLFPALVFALGVSPLDGLLLALLLVLLPALSMAQLPLVEEGVIERMPAYWSSIVTLWLLGTGCWIVGTRADGPGALLLVPIDAVAFGAWTVALTAAALGIILLFRWLGGWLALSESPLLRELLPRTRRERGAFALLSVAAGFGEEIAYRGYAIGVLTPLMGLGGAVAVSTVAFGAMHAYQGAVGVVRTGLMGLALAWGMIASGSLWPAIVAHTLIDLLAGIVLGERLLPPPASDGVPTDLVVEES